jgi:DNA-binding NarL/FixJ family response regulator
MAPQRPRQIVGILMQNNNCLQVVATSKIFVVDDHPIVRQGLVQLICSERDLVVCGEGEDAYEALRAIRRTKPDLVLLDISLKGSDGIELLKELRAGGDDTHVLVLSMHDETLYADRSLRAGARGYIMKHEAPQVLLTAIRLVLKGEIYVSEKLRGTLLQRIIGRKMPVQSSPMERLTDRELEVFRLIGSGRTVRDIAEKLCLSPKTVEAHREHIKDKLNLDSSVELLRFAIRSTPEQN